MHSLELEGTKIKFAYTDSGVPSNGASNYITIFAVHGMGFNAGIFEKVENLAYESGIRFVAITRRGYKGSTPYSEREREEAISGTGSEKASFIAARGIELAKFMEAFIGNNNLPPISDDGRSGGVALLGFSGGITFAASAIANVDKLSSKSQARFASYMRAHIMMEPSSICLGLPLPPKRWSPLIDTSLPEQDQTPMYTSWVTSYFDHGDLSSRDINELSYCVPSTLIAPSIYNMSSEEQKAIIEDKLIGFEATIMFETQTQAHAVYRKACFNNSIKKTLPRMKTKVLVGDKTCSFPLNGMFSIEEDNEKNKGDIQFSILEGVNHFMQWDEPEKTLEAYIDAM